MVPQVETRLTSDFIKMEAQDHQYKIISGLLNGNQNTIAEVVRRYRKTHTTNTVVVHKK